MSVKSKKSMLKMSRLSPQVKALEAKYGDDKQKYQLAVQQMYKEEGVSMGGGCLWSFIPVSYTHLTGTLVLTPDAKQPFELQASEVFVEGPSTPDYPIQPKRDVYKRQVKGGWLALKRLLRCNPFYKGDYFDPVP